MKWVCSACGSDQVEEKMWVELNTANPELTPTGDYDESNYWCNGCEEHRFHITEEEYQKQNSKTETTE